MPESRKRTINLPIEVDEIVARVGNASDYIARLIVDHHEQWRSALARLRAAGWTEVEVLGACDAFNGTFLGDAFHQRGDVLAMELADAERLNGLSPKWGFDAEHFRGLYTQLAEEAEGGGRELAHALVTVVREFWSGNDAVDAALRGRELNETKAARRER